MTARLFRLQGWLRLASVVILLTPFAGCARKLIFSTYTTLGVELKGAAGELPSSLCLGYKRFEGAVVPVNPANKGASATSVLAAITAEQSFSRVHVNQVFATGLAARVAAEAESTQARAGRPGPISRSVEALKARGTP